MCNCWSLGLDGPIDTTTKDKPVAMFNKFQYKIIYVDACIADHVRELLDAEIPTLASCCGHNGGYHGASIVIDQPEGDYRNARVILDGMQGDHIELYAWRLENLDA